MPRARVHVPGSTQLPMGSAAIRSERMLVAVALLIRGARLLQAVLTVVLGFAAFRPPALGLAAGCVAVAWSLVLSLTAWRAGHFTTLVVLGDTAVAIAVMAMLSAAIPQPSLTTSFYWAMPYAQSAALVAGLTRTPDRWTGLAALCALVLAYSLLIYLGAGTHALFSSAGNTVGTVGFFATAVVIGGGVRYLSRDLDRANESAQERAAALGTRRAQLEEFRRLHDEAIQVFERTSAGDEPISPQLRASARQAADHLRATMVPTADQSSSLQEQLSGIADRFGAVGFEVIVVWPNEPLPAMDTSVSTLVRDAVAEAITNARKHSGSGRVWLRVSREGEGVVVSVEDKGSGFDPILVIHGFGLTNSIRGRLEEVGGRVDVQSAPDSGTVIKMWIPC